MAAKKKRTAGWERKYWFLWGQLKPHLVAAGLDPEEERKALTAQVIGAENASHKSMDSAQFTLWRQHVEGMMPEADLDKILTLAEREVAEKAKQAGNPIPCFIWLVENRLERLNAGDGYAQTIAKRILRNQEPGPWRELPGDALTLLVRALEKTIRAKPLANQT